MKMLVAVVFVAALAACSKEEPAGSSLSAQEEALLGTWEQINDSAIEGTVRLTFRANGTFELFIEAFGASITTTGTYQVDGDSFRLDAKKSTIIDDDGDELEITAEELVEGDLNGTYTIEGDTLFITTTEENEDGEESVVTVEYRRT